MPSSMVSHGIIRGTNVENWDKNWWGPPSLFTLESREGGVQAIKRTASVQNETQTQEGRERLSGMMVVVPSKERVWFGPTWEQIAMVGDVVIGLDRVGDELHVYNRTQSIKLSERTPELIGARMNEFETKLANRNITPDIRIQLRGLFDEVQSTTDDTRFSLRSESEFVFTPQGGMIVPILVSQPEGKLGGPIAYPPAYCPSRSATV